MPVNLTAVASADASAAGAVGHAHMLRWRSDASPLVSSRAVGKTAAVEWGRRRAPRALDKHMTAESIRSRKTGGWCGPGSWHGRLVTARCSWRDDAGTASGTPAMCRRQMEGHQRQCYLAPSRKLRSTAVGGRFRGLWRRRRRRWLQQLLLLADSPRRRRRSSALPLSLRTAARSADRPPSIWRPEDFVVLVAATRWWKPRAVNTSPASRCHLVTKEWQTYGRVVDGIHK